MKNYQKLKLATSIHEHTPKPFINFSPETVEKFGTFTQVLLGVIAATGVATMAIVAPNALQALNLFMKKKGRKAHYESREKKLVRAFHYLKGKGYIHLVEKGDTFEVSLSEAGLRHYGEICDRQLVVPRPAAWDRKFWQVAADIPTEHRLAADSLRRKIKRMQFYPLQRTLWYYPYDPRIQIDELTRDFGIEQYVTVMRVDEMDPQDLKVITDYFKDLHVI